MDNIRSIAKNTLNDKNIQEKQIFEEKTQKLFNKIYKELENHVNNLNTVESDFIVSSCFDRKLSGEVENHFRKLGFKTEKKACYCDGYFCNCSGFIIMKSNWIN